MLSPSGTPVATILLQDEGFGHDMTMNDGIYSGEFASALAGLDAGLYTVRVDARATNLSSIHLAYAEPDRSLPLTPSPAAPVCCGSSVDLLGAIQMATGEQQRVVFAGPVWVIMGDRELTWGRKEVRMVVRGGSIEY